MQGLQRSTYNLPQCIPPLVCISAGWELTATAQEGKVFAKVEIPTSSVLKKNTSRLFISHHIYKFLGEESSLFMCEYVSLEAFKASQGFTFLNYLNLNNPN